MTNETAQPTNVGSNDQLGLSPERAAFEAWAAQRWGREARRHTSATCAEWDAWQAARVDLVAALQWYADGLHFDRASPDAWDTVSGEPQNWWCDEAGTATVEDGSIAAMTLRGELTAAQIQALARYALQHVAAGMDRCVLYAYGRTTLDWPAGSAGVSEWNRWCSIINGGTVSVINRVSSRGHLACVINGTNYLV